MTRQEAVVLSYLEWVRLIKTGGIRLDERRILRWSAEKLEPTEIVTELMLGAPDLGTSANAFVLAMLAPKVLDRVRTNGIDLGERLPIEMVQSFHSFTETARTVHGHDADAAGVEIELTSLAQGWLRWVENVHTVDRQAQGTNLVKLLSLSALDWSNQSIEWVASQESSIDYEKIARWRDTMYYGWACILNLVKDRRPGAKLEPPAVVMEDIQRLQKDYNVDQPFFSAAPILCKFVQTLANENEAPSDLLALAGLKQHERYVAKREGAALDLESLHADIDFLKEQDIAATNMLARALGERLPAELLHALKASLTKRDVTKYHADASLPRETYPSYANAATGDAGAERKISSDVFEKPIQGATLNVGTDAGQFTIGLTGSANDTQTHDGEGLLRDGAVNPGSANLHLKAKPKLENNSLPQVALDANLDRSTPSEPSSKKSQLKDADEAQSSLFDDPKEMPSSAKSFDEPDVAHISSNSAAAHQPAQPNRIKLPKKYAPLKKYFSDLPASSTIVQLTFAEVEKRLGAPLPKGARKKPFWANDGDKSTAWIEAGFKQVEINLAETDTEAWVRFERAS